MTDKGQECSGTYLLSSGICTKADFFTFSSLENTSKNELHVQGLEVRYDVRFPVQKFLISSQAFFPMLCVTVDFTSKQRNVSSFCCFDHDLPFCM